MTRRRDLTDRIAVVAGTSANIGAGIAIGLAEAGAAVACLDRNEAAATATAADITAQGGRALAFRCDTTVEDEVATVVEAAAAALGPLDVLVNGAAFYNTKGIRDMPLSEWRDQIGVILDSAFLVSQCVVRHWLATGRGGSIVTLTSTAAYQGEVGNVAYCTAKAGLLNFSRSIAMELAPFGIRSNTLSPTATDPTESIERSLRWGTAPLPAEAVAALDRAASLLPMGRAPSPSHYADAVVFLASEAAEMITGMDLRVDAGALARYWRT